MAYKSKTEGSKEVHFPPWLYFVTVKKDGIKMDIFLHDEVVSKLASELWGVWLRNFWGGQVFLKIQSNSWLFEGFNIKLCISKEAM